MAAPDFKRVPTANPPFSIGTLRKAIPAHCFERSLAKSSAYLAADLAGVALLFACSTLIPSAPVAARWVLWPAYWWAQGSVCTGLWVVAHECGHQVSELGLLRCITPPRIPYRRLRMSPFRCAMGPH